MSEQQQHRTPHVGHGIDGALRSADIDRSEADIFATGSDDWRRLMASADRWIDQARDLVERQARDLVEQQAPAFGPRLAFGVSETLADGTQVLNVSVQHVAATLPVDDDDDEQEQEERPAPRWRSIGQVWNTGTLGWAASAVMEGDDWSAIVQRAERSFPDRETAGLFLYGFDAALRWQRAQVALAAMPWRIRPASEAAEEVAGGELAEGRPHGVI